MGRDRRYRTYSSPKDCKNAASFEERIILLLYFSTQRNVMKKRRYLDLYGYTSDEFDHLLERSINKKLRSAGKSKSALDMRTVFAAYKDETRTLPRRRLREMRITARFSTSEGTNI
jgi:hypothetical protein